jgi:fucose 4-O-acetylase-like acetyltransferase
MLGQASLPVFCVHLLCVFFALTVMGSNAMLTGWPAAVLVAVSFTALLLTAIVANRRAVKAAAGRVAPLVTLPAAKQQG